MDSPFFINTRQRSWPNPRVWSASPVVWGALRSAVFCSAWLGQVLPQHWRFPPASGSNPPGFYPLGLLPGAWSAPNKENADRAEGIFGNTGRVWDWTHLKNGLVLYFSGGGTENKYLTRPTWQNHMWYHFRSGRIVTTPLDSQLPIN